MHMARNREDAPLRDSPQSLAEYLANVRIAKRMTLREVEQASEGVVSNAYLSQVEHGRITHPSPNILYSLAEVYGVAYEVLMEKAGYVTAAAAPRGKHGRVPTFADKDLTPAEQEALLEFLAFLRSRKLRK
jgi:transcriptional regulator with XRE-family HTH domain